MEKCTIVDKQNSYYTCIAVIIARTITVKFKTTKHDAIILPHAFNEVTRKEFSTTK